MDYFDVRPEENPLLFLRPGVLVPLSDGASLIRCARIGAKVIPPDFVPLLRRVTKPTPLFALHEQLRNGPGSLSKGMDFLNDLMRDGFICSLKAGRQGHPARTMNSTIGVVGVVTNGRPELMRRTLDSLLVDIGNTRGKRDVVVMDDSRDPSIRAQNMREARRVGQRFGVVVRYAGFQQKKRYVRALSKELKGSTPLAEKALLDHFRIGSTRGANTNALLLDAAEARLMCFDDDARCKVARPRQLRGLSLSSRPIPFDCVPFWRREELMQETTQSEISLIERHEELLGRSIRDVVLQSEALEAHESDPFLLHAAVEGRGHIAVTWSGIYGDSGSSSCRHYLFFKGEERSRLLRSREFYDGAISSRLTWKAPKGVTVSRSGAFQSVAFGVDNTRFIPPFVPFLRASDVVFGRCLTAYLDDTVIAYLPDSVAHEPKPVRVDDRDVVWKSAGWLRLEQLINLCLNTWRRGALSSMSPEDTLISVGTHLTDLASLSWAEFTEVLWPVYAAGVRREIVALETLLRENKETPHFWADDARRAMELLERRLRSPDPLTISERGIPDVEPGASTLALVAAIGEVFRSWPDLRETAIRMSRGGIRISETLA